MNRRFAWSLTLTAATLLTLTGCQSSQDEDTWVSSPIQPKSLSLIQLQGDTEKSVWSMDIPAYHKLETEIIRGDTSPPKKALVGSYGAPRAMRWRLYDTAGGDERLVRADKLELDGKPVKWSWDVRDAGQQPRAQLGGPEAVDEGDTDQPPTQPETPQGEIPATQSPQE